jgi:hypothetical protein
MWLWAVDVLVGGAGVNVAVGGSGVLVTVGVELEVGVSVTVGVCVGVLVFTGVFVRVAVCGTHPLSGSVAETLLEVTVMPLPMGTDSVAVFVTGEITLQGKGTSTRIWIRMRPGVLGEPPGTTMPVQLTIVPRIPQLPVPPSRTSAAIGESPAGIASSTLTPIADAPPVLLTVMMKSTNEPACPIAGLKVLLMSPMLGGVGVFVLVGVLVLVGVEVGPGVLVFVTVGVFVGGGVFVTVGVFVAGGVRLPDPMNAEMMFVSAPLEACR